MDILRFSIPYFISICMFALEVCKSVDALSSSEPIRDGDTLVSAGEKFQLGFFSPGHSSNRYLAIWYHNIPNKTIVWVANRDNPVNGSSGVLRIGNEGKLVLVDQAERVLWSSNNMNTSSQSIVAQLLDSGNLVLKDDSENVSGNYLWQSFDNPSDTTLPGMKLGWDLRTGLDRHMTSWKSAEDPSTGDFTYGVDLGGNIPQLVLRKGHTKYFRTGPWNGIQFSGARIAPNLIFIPKFVDNSQEVYYTFNAFNESTITRFVLNVFGNLQRYMWNEKTQEWTLIYMFPHDACDVYANCGPNSMCTISNPQICSCMIGYQPKSQAEWDSLVWTSGCVSKNPFNCSRGEGFKRLKGVKIPDLLQFRMNTSMTLKECELKCFQNCSCRAYANVDATGGAKGCLLWFGDLIDVRKLIEYANQDLFIRVSAADLGNSANSKWKVWVPVAISSAIVMLLVVLYICIFWKRKKSAQGIRLDFQAEDDTSLQLPIFDMVTILRATNNFCDSNKLGEGGFGPVYKGQLPNGQEIAVKRLSEDSRQGLNEFKNEVMLIAKLQHRNLVKLVGCCVEEERMLIYEYMPNGSLDTTIFGKTGENSLVWRRRFNIIIGIVRGLLYLHQDSRLRIIHRDLKASNVLLDSEINPKISDFGVARVFGGDLSQAKTKRIVGTYGYMAPEYAIDGLFSTKSDVFSFGVLLLEIICGKKNREFNHPDHSFNLVGHAWKLWLEGQVSDFIDPQLPDSFDLSEVVKCIQIGLLCVQRCPDDRPNMSSVLLMLDSESASLPQPKQPGFYIERSSENTDIEMSRRECNSNEITTTLLEGR
ncbi:G-type lectin S-receptor-like serine/threonine-protein kinase At4g27290 [Syzygium oleosum]|uniref:G-type lectin S-receptor-like serine/threonine-protein kinase At4g27290 n=1 Tax=Syzygium oleosum TaxID=219896 RepID=UPI0024BAEF59|nr:G-type lectin S-receptor-like serine/threonine-protein kinase At4g27290 [Syzygium oleosum]